MQPTAILKDSKFFINKISLRPLPKSLSILNRTELIISFTFTTTTSVN